MTREEFEKYRKPMPESFTRLPIPIGNDQREDEYGIYSTGFFRYKGKDILVANENGKWHLSASCDLQ